MKGSVDWRCTGLGHINKLLLFNLHTHTWCKPKHNQNLILVEQPLVHDVVKMCEEICVWGDVLPPLHDPADQLVGMKFTLLITLWQHGGLQTITRRLNDQWKETEIKRNSEIFKSLKPKKSPHSHLP